STSKKSSPVSECFPDIVTVQTDAECPADSLSGITGASAFHINSAPPILASKFKDTGAGLLADIIEPASVIIFKGLNNPSVILNVGLRTARKITLTLANRP